MRHLIIDGLNLFIRSFTVVPAMDINGEHVGGMIGFLMTLNKLVRENSPDRVYVIWDGEGGSWKRRSIFKDYKQGRKPKTNREYDFESPEESRKSFSNQLIRLSEYLEELPVVTIMIRATEADDVIAYLWNVLPREDQKVIVSSDRDFYQLLDTKTVMYVPTKKKYYTSQSLREEMNVLPENFILMKAFCGDSSDNIPGIKGIGKKTFVKLFPFVAERFAEASELREYAEQNASQNAQYGKILSQWDLVSDNVCLMQLTSPLMDPLTAVAIREKLQQGTPRYRPTEVKLRLIKDGLQIKSHDFFTTFKDQVHRHGRS